MSLVLVVVIVIVLVVVRSRLFVFRQLTHSLTLTTHSLLLLQLLQQLGCTSSRWLFVRQVRLFLMRRVLVCSFSHAFVFSPHASIVCSPDRGKTKKVEDDDEEEVVVAVTLTLCSLLRRRGGETEHGGGGGG